MLNIAFLFNSLLIYHACESAGSFLCPCSPQTWILLCKELILARSISSSGSLLPKMELSSMPRVIHTLVFGSTSKRRWHVTIYLRLKIFTTSSTMDAHDLFKFHLLTIISIAFVQSDSAECDVCICIQFVEKVNRGRNGRVNDRDGPSL